MRSMRGAVYLLVLTMVICNSLWPTSAMAQTDRGTIAGTVKDTTDAVLLGARIAVQPLGKNVVSDGQGQFRITDLPPGDYTLTISYVGFETFSTPVKVAGGQVANVDAVLKVGSQTSEVTTSVSTITARSRRACAGLHEENKNHPMAR